MEHSEWMSKWWKAVESGDSKALNELQMEAAMSSAKFYETHKNIAINARRARYMVDHWDDEQFVYDVDLKKERPLRDVVRGEPYAIDLEIRFNWEEKHPEFAEQLKDLRQEINKKEFWENLAENMEGTQLSACGLSFKKFTYDSSLKPLWDLEVDEPPPAENPSPVASVPPPPLPPSSPSAPVRPRRKRKWGFHPIGCLGRLVKLFFKLLLPAWLVLFAIHLWSPPAGDAPKPEPAKPKQAASVAAAKPAAGRPTAGQTQQAPQTGGKRFAVKQPLPIYRFDAEKKPVLMGRVPSGTVLQVVGKVNPKVARVSFALPDGRTVTGMARVADLKERTEVAE